MALRLKCVYEPPGTEDGTIAYGRAQHAAPLSAVALASPGLGRLGTLQTK